MDFDFPLIQLLPLPITLVPAATFVALENNQSQVQQVFASSVSIGVSKGSANNGYSSISSSYSSSTSASSLLSDQERLGAIVDALGQASAKAQELPTSITQKQRLAQNPTHRVYILRTGLDSGEDQWLNQMEIGSPLMKESIRKSLLDLNGTTTIDSQYADIDESTVSPQEQVSKRSTRTRGEEKGVYVAGMLKMGEKKLFIVVEGIDPTQIAYDRPSPKLYRFLSKHFQLIRHLPQPNLFAIFEGFKLLDCGETIQVDDGTLSAGRAPIPLPIPGSSFADTVGTNGNSVSTGIINGCRPAATSRALQSSLVFSSGVALDLSGNPLNNHQSASRPQPPIKRISSAFSSSFSLASPSTMNSGSGGGMQNTTTSAKISRLLASSIVFADPVTSSD
ncbi:Alpha-tubulin N-acetyltransferase 1 [Modicella reniformis]|uniref:Alpha-tubulin N-acetyltransferase 1 n=1 Tax=Modicella reniformis TaxID=1440133 RepID=A0A9P6M9Y2_9FUNG|nr:Alpha-tubulin N-acetyltransferase 1 [Modicella reniformis]